MAQSRLKIFGVLNHVGHQYEMLKLAKKYPVKFYYLENNVRRWPRTGARPQPTEWLSEEEFEWVDRYEDGKYDVAILHTDQQHVDPNIGKGHLYRQLNNRIQDIPKIVVNHGTPMWDEQFDEDMVINGGEILDKNGNTKQIEGMKRLIGDNFMIVNSYDAVNRWGFGYPIIHGFDPEEWFDLPKEPRVSISLSPAGLDKYYNRQLLSQIKGYVMEKTGIEVIHFWVNYVAHDWLDYRETLSKSLIYINPTLDSPMPRSRTDAFLSGCCVLTSKYHNADEFVEHGVNGFIVPDNPLSYAEAIYHLINNNYKEAIEIGQRGKQMAQKNFHIDRYLEDLYNVVTKVADGQKPQWKGEKRWD